MIGCFGRAKTETPVKAAPEGALQKCLDEIAASLQQESSVTSIPAGMKGAALGHCFLFTCQEGVFVKVKIDTNAPLKIHTNPPDWDCLTHATRSLVLLIHYSFTKTPSRYLNPGSLVCLPYVIQHIFIAIITVKSPYDINVTVTVVIIARFVIVLLMLISIIGIIISNDTSTIKCCYNKYCLM